MEVMEGSGFEVCVGGLGTLREEVDGENVLHFECFFSPLFPLYPLLLVFQFGLLRSLKVYFLSPTMSL